MALGIVAPGASYVDHSYQSNRSNALSGGFYSNISSAAEEATNKNDGKVIGLAMLPFGNTNRSYGMKAQYAPESTESDPIVQVTSNYGGKPISYNVHINEVNPRNASQLEMFALFSYTDDQGISDGGTFGSYHRMNVYAENAKENGYWTGNDSYDDFMNNKHDWQKIVIAMWEDYSKAGIYSQMLKCISLNETMEKFSIKFVDFDNIDFEDRTDEVSLKYTGPDLSMEVMKGRFEEEEETETDQQLFQKYMQDLLEKIKSGDTEESFQIGGSSFTLKEWEEFLEKFDSAEDDVKRMLKEMIEEQIKAKKKAETSAQEKQSSEEI